MALIAGFVRAQWLSGGAVAVMLSPWQWQGSGSQPRSLAEHAAAFFGSPRKDVGGRDERQL